MAKISSQRTQAADAKAQAKRVAESLAKAGVEAVGRMQIVDAFLNSVEAA